MLLEFCNSPMQFSKLYLTEIKLARITNFRVTAIYLIAKNFRLQKPQGIMS